MLHARKGDVRYIVSAWAGAPASERVLRRVSVLRMKRAAGRADEPASATAAAAAVAPSPPQDESTWLHTHKTQALSAQTLLLWQFSLLFRSDVLRAGARAEHGELDVFGVLAGAADEHHGLALRLA